MVETKASALQAEVKPDQIALSIVIGDGQIGGSVVKMNGANVGGPGTIKNLKLGPGAALKGMTIEAKTLVRDLNTNTDNTSVTYRLTNATPSSQTLAHTVKKHGNAVLYTTKLTFK